MPVATTTEPTRLRVFKIAAWVVAGILLCAAICLFAVSTVSFQTLRGWALSSIPPGYEDRFTPALFSKIILGLRLLAAAFGISALLTTFFCGQLGRMLLAAVGNLRALSTEVKAAAEKLRNDPLYHVLCLAAVLIWEICLRLAFFGEPIRNDEAYSFMHYASRPIYVGLTYYTTNNHILNTVLMHISTLLLGASVWAVRLPTLIAGILIVPATYLVVRLYHNPTAALLSAALVSASSPLIEYSFNARGYSLGTLFFLLMLLATGFAIHHQSPGAWIFVPVSAALALYSVATMLYGVAGVFLYLLLRRSALRMTVIVMIWTAILTVILYSPVFATVGLSAFTQNQWAVPLPRNVWPSEFIHELASLWWYWNLDVPKLISIFIVAGAISAVLFRKTLRLPPVSVLLCTSISALVLLFVQSLVIPRRSWLFLLPLYFGAAGAGWTTLIRKFRFANALLTLVAVLVAAWMGSMVLIAKSLRHSGIEAAGPRSVEAVALGAKPYLLQGAQFICNDYFDSGLDFEMRVHGIPYRPSPTGSLLIVTPAGATPQRTIALAGLSDADVLSLHKIAHYEDADVYLGNRGPNLPFIPRGTTEMGVFTAGSN